MTLHRLSPKTLSAYMIAVKSLSAHYKQSPEKLTDSQIQNYLDYIIIDRNLACPAGKRLYRSGRGFDTKGNFVTRFKAPKSACGPCKLRSECFRHPDRSPKRSVAYFHSVKKNKDVPDTATERMKQKIDSIEGRQIYSKRLGEIIEQPNAYLSKITFSTDSLSLKKPSPS